MKLLIITQKIDQNDDVLGFMHRWVEEFARQCEQVTVVCLEKGEYSLPGNVRILSLGKEQDMEHETWNMKQDVQHRVLNKKRFWYIARFYKLIWRERNNYDTVFVHMNTEYVVLGGWLWRMLGKNIWLWYAHGYVPLSLRIAEKFTQHIFTSTKSGCRVPSHKIKVVGQGIDVRQFAKHEAHNTNQKLFTIVTVGRLSPVKDIETLISAVDTLKKQGVDMRVRIVGGAGLLEQKKYEKKLRQLVVENNLEEIIHFEGAVPNTKIASYLQSADLFVNTSHTGSLDKAVLEAMAASIPILTCNEALEEVLGDDKGQLMYPKGDAQALAEKIQQIQNMSREGRNMLGESLRKIVVEQHSIEGLIKKILLVYR